jgi:hypothetical protein
LGSRRSLRRRFVLGGFDLGPWFAATGARLGDSRPRQRWVFYWARRWP